MSDGQEMDVEALRSELDQIKDAMGIRERYEGATQIWLLFGVLVAVAAGISQYIVLDGLAGWLHWVNWAGVLGGGFTVWFLVTDTASEMSFSGEGKPHLGFQFMVVFLAVYPVSAVAEAYVPALSETAESAMMVSLILVMLGVAYAVMGASLRAYYVRRVDRYTFYVGTVLMVGLGTLVPHVEVLQTWAYAAFGGAYFVYAVAAWAFLSRT